MKWYPSVPLETLRRWDRKFNDVVFAVGNFDGVHRGHRALLEAARAKADELGCRAGVLTFAPHPRRYFAGPDKPPFLLTRGVEQRGELPEATGMVDAMVELAFNTELSSVEAEDFAQSILAVHLGTRHVLAGPDFRFGHKRGGDMLQLGRWGQDMSFGVSAVPLRHDDEEGGVISSSRVRQALMDADIVTANRLLGRRWSAEGVFERGDQIGRTLGFPTANLSWPALQLRPHFGVYAGWAAINGGEQLPAVSYLGTRPTVDGVEERFEVHLLDWTGDIYGESVRFWFDSFIHPDLEFQGLEALKVQIAEDCDEARRRLGLGPKT
mgnify:FL=1